MDIGLLFVFFDDLPLYNGNTDGPGAFLAFFNIKLNFGAFGKGFERITDNPGMMDKILTPVFRGDESIALLIVKPFNCSL